MKKMAFGQLLSLLFIIRAARFIANPPVEFDGNYAVGCLFSAVLQIICILPAVMLCESCAKRPVLIFLPKPVQNILNMLLAAALIFFGGLLLGDVGIYTKSAVLWESPAQIPAILIIAVVFFGLRLGLHGTLRASALIFALFSAGIVLFFALVFFRIPTEIPSATANLSADRILRHTLFDFAQSAEILPAILLIPLVTRRARAAVFGEIALKIGVGELFGFCAFAIIGSCAAVCGNAVSALGSFTGGRRIDAILCIFTTIATVAGLIVFSHLAGESVKRVFPKLKYSAYLCAALTALISVFLPAKSDAVLWISAAVLAFSGVISYIALAVAIRLKEAATEKNKAKGR